MPRGNIDNLKPPSSEEARNRGQKGGKKSAEVRAKRKLLKDELLALLNETFTDPYNDKTKDTARRLMSARLVEQAIKGDTDAFKVIRDTIGEKPTERLQVGADEDTIAKMDAFFDFLKDMGSR